MRTSTPDNFFAGLLLLPFGLVGMLCSVATPVFLVFLVLKLCGTIDWSWWYVCAPVISMAVLLCSAVTALVLLGSFIERINRA